MEIYRINQWFTNLDRSTTKWDELGKIKVFIVSTVRRKVLYVWSQKGERQNYTNLSEKKSLYFIQEFTKIKYSSIQEFKKIIQCVLPGNKSSDTFVNIFKYNFIGNLILSKFQ